jgi:hypothetical protein
MRARLQFFDSPRRREAVGWHTARPQGFSRFIQRENVAARTIAAYTKKAVSEVIVCNEGKKITTH